MILGRNRRKGNREKVKFEEENSEANTYTQEDLKTIDFIKSIGKTEAKKKEIIGIYIV